MINTTTNKSIIEEYESLNELYETITNRPNAAGMGSANSSSTGTSAFCGTSSFEYAVSLLKNGDQILIDKIMNAVKLDKNYTQDVKKSRNEYNVHGYQASVPRYLQGVPTSMINSKTIQQKQKVINIVKSIGFNAFVNKETIIEESKKAVQIIQLVESKGYRVNLKMVWNTTGRKHSVAMIVQVKHSSERLNIAKLAFPLANPSMLRRISFKWLETLKDIPDSYRFGYGKSETEEQVIKSNVPQLKDAYIIPSYVKNVDELVASWNLK